MLLLLLLLLVVVLLVFLKAFWNIAVLLEPGFCTLLCSWEFLGQEDRKCMCDLGLCMCDWGLPTSVIGPKDTFLFCSICKKSCLKYVSHLFLLMWVASSICFEFCNIVRRHLQWSEEELQLISESLMLQDKRCFCFAALLLVLFLGLAFQDFQSRYQYQISWNKILYRQLEGSSLHGKGHISTMLQHVIFTMTALSKDITTKKGGLPKIISNGFRLCLNLLHSTLSLLKSFLFLRILTPKDKPLSESELFIHRF